MEPELNRAANCLNSGGILLYPTDTIWGIGCNASDEKAVEGIYRIKNRSDSKSMLVLVSDLDMLKNLVAAVPDSALDIISSSSQPTTIIYPGARNLAGNLVAVDGSIGIRLTRDPFCSALIKKTGLALVSSSANISGKSAPGRFIDISEDILTQVDYVVNWRQDEKEPSQASSIVRIEADGRLVKIR